MKYIYLHMHASTLKLINSFVLATIFGKNPLKFQWKCSISSLIMNLLVIDEFLIIKC